MSAVFPFPGGKSRHADWIIDTLPQHTCYVEVFGGAAGVLFNKDPDECTVEVYNDVDGDLVQFFEVLRDDTAALIEWLESVPYSRAVYDEWAEAFYQGYRPADPVARAGRFFFLRYAQWGGKYASPAGFGTSKVRNSAMSFANKRDRLDEFAARFEKVVIENLDWRDVFEKYDSPETVFYCDPPYVEKQDYYPVPEINHEALLTAIDELDGECLCTYDAVPATADPVSVEQRQGTYTINSGQSGTGKETTERLLCTFESP